MLVLIKFSFWEEDWALACNSLKFWHYSELPLGLSRSVTHEATRIYRFITNNQVSLHLVKHQKFSKYYDHGCSSIMYEQCMRNLIVRIGEQIGISPIRKRQVKLRIAPLETIYLFTTIQHPVIILVFLPVRPKHFY